jgi:phage anti-repressor protein
MEELIKYSTLEMRLFGNDEVNSVSLRELYNDLGYDDTNFTTWAKRNLVEEFEQNSDYITLFLEKKGSTGLTKQTDYLITLDVGKELAMMSRKPKGKLIRKYFIEVEKMARKELQMTPLDPMEQARLAMASLTKALDDKAKKLELNKKLLTGAETVIQNIAEDILDLEIDMGQYCSVLTSRATDVVIGRTSLYIILRGMKLVTKDGTRPTAYGSATYLEYRQHEHGVSTKIRRERMSALTKAIMRYLLNNEDVNESLGFPFHPELRD